MGNLETRIRAQQRAAQRRATPTPDFDAIIHAHAQRFEAIKLRAEDRHDRQDAKQYGSYEEGTPEFEQRLGERKSARMKGKSFRDDTFPEQQWYTDHVVPALRDIAPTIDGFERHSNIILTGLEDVAKEEVHDEQYRAHPLQVSVEAYLSHLHNEDPRVFFGLLHANLHRINMRGDGGSDPYRSFEIEGFIESIKQSPYAAFLPEIFEVFGGIPNGHTAPKFKNNILKILESFTTGRSLKDVDTGDPYRSRMEKEDPEERTETLPSKAHLIPTYFRIARAAQSPMSHDFDFASTSVFSHIAAFEKAGQYFDAAVELAEAGFIRDRRKYEHNVDPSSIVHCIKALAASPLRDELPRILARATALNKERLRGEQYLWRFEQAVDQDRRVLPADASYYLRNEDRIVEFARTLARHSKPAANLYLYQEGTRVFSQAMPWNLPPAQRELYHEMGLRLVQEFGDIAKKYFAHAATVLALDPDKFEMWLDRIVRFGRAVPRPQSSYTLGEFIENAHGFLRRGMLDATLTAALALEARVEALKAEEKEQGMNRGGLDDPLRTFISSAAELAGTDVSVGRFANSLFSLYRSHREFFSSYLVHHACNDMNYDELEALFPLIISSDLHNSLHQLKEIVNAPIAIARKEALIKEYALASSVFHWDNKPNLDLAGTWREGVREKIIDNLGDAWEGHDFSEFDLMTLLRLNSISVYDLDATKKRKLEYILAQEQAGKNITKAYPLGKSYGIEVVGGVNAQQDPVQLTLNLLTALTTANAERRAAAAAHFDGEKIARAQEYASSRVVFDVIKEFLPQIKQGDHTAARSALKALEAAFPRSEDISDLVTSADGSFTHDIAFDALEARMQTGRFRDLFDNRDTFCCAFYPSGVNARGSINYLLDEHVGLLHLIPHSRGDALDPVGVAIMIQTRDPRTGEKYLLIDSVEAGASIDRVRDSAWIPLMHRAIMQVAADTGMDFVMYNNGGTQLNAKPRRVLSYVSRTFQPEERELDLYKLQEEGGRLASYNDGRALIRLRNARLGSRSYDLDREIENAERAYASSIRIYAEAWKNGVEYPDEREPGEQPYDHSHDAIMARLTKRANELPVPGGSTCGYVLPVIRNSPSQSAESHLAPANTSLTQM